MIKQDNNKISIADKVVGKASISRFIKNETSEVTMQRKFMQYTGGIVLMILTILGFAANANATVSPVQFSQGSFSATISDKSVGQLKIAGVGAGTVVLADQSLHTGAPKNCKTFKVFWNTGVNVNGKKFSFKDYNGKLCRTKKSPTGWTKRGGGKSGRDCDNEAAPISKPPKAPVAKGRVKNVASFSFRAQATAKATVTLPAFATASCKTDSTSASSTINGTGTATATVTVTATAKSAASALSSATSKALKATTTQKVSLTGKAQAEASVQISGKAEAYCAQQNAPTPNPECVPPSTGTYPECKTPPAPSEAQCTGLTASSDLAIARTVNAHVDYSALNATFINVVFSWGDGKTDSTTSQDASHTYTAAGTYRVGAVLKFSTPYGNREVTCSDVFVTAKDGTTGAGSTTPGQPGGYGSGGSPGNPTTGTQCRDQFGYIVTGTPGPDGKCV